MFIFVQLPLNLLCLLRGSLMPRVNFEFPGKFGQCSWPIAP